MTGLYRLYKHLQLTLEKLAGLYTSDSQVKLQCLIKAKLCNCKKNTVERDDWKITENCVDNSYIQVLVSKTEN